MAESLSPADGSVRHACRRRSWSGRILVLLVALIVLAIAPLSAAGHAPGQVSADTPVSRIAFEIEYADSRAQIVTVRADANGGVQQLVPGMQNEGGFCQSAEDQRPLQGPQERVLVLVRTVVAATDIGRSIYGLEIILAGRDGSVYAVRACAGPFLDTGGELDDLQADSCCRKPVVKEGSHD